MKTSFLLLQTILFLTFASVSPAWWWSAETPDDAIKTIGELKNKDGVIKDQKHFTPQGKAVLLWLLDKGTGNDGNTTHKIQQSQVDGLQAKIPVIYSDGTEAYFLLIQDEKTWRFHDAVITRSNGKAVDWHISYIKDHPVGFYLSNVPWGQMLNAFLEGFAIGANLNK